MNKALLGVSILTFVGVLWVLSIVRELQPGLAPPPPPPPTPTYFVPSCFKVLASPPPGAHLDVDDRFCVTDNAGFWFLVPDKGMDDWHSIAGPKEIPLDVKANELGVFLALFDVTVEGHPGPEPPNTHGPQHSRPDFGYMLHVNVAGSATTAKIQPIGRPGGPVHGGSAHTDLD